MKIITKRMRRKLNLVWHHIQERCYNIKCKDYYNYGKRGIKVCDEWLKSFENFYIWAIINGYEEGLTLDRIDVNEGYYPENCRWVDRIKQNINRRLFKSNTSGYKGICYKKNLNKWQSYIVVKTNHIYLGIYDTQKEALEARNKYIIDNGLDYPIQEYKGEISSLE